MIRKIGGDAKYAWGGSGIYRSTDHGKTWNVNLQGLTKGAHDAAVDTNGFLWAATSGGVFRQHPDSISYDSIYPSSFMRIQADRMNRIICAEVFNKVTISSNNGVTWQTVTLPNEATSPLDIADDKYHNIYILYVGSGGATELFVSSLGTGPFTSLTSTLTSTISLATRINSISGDSVLLIGTRMGLYSATGKGTILKSHQEGISTESATSIIKTPSGTVICSNILGVHIKKKSDQQWQQSYPNFGFHNDLPIVADDAGNIAIYDRYIHITPYPAAPLIVSHDDLKNITLDTLGASIVDVYEGRYIDDHEQLYAFRIKRNGSVLPALWSKTLGAKWAYDTTGLSINDTTTITCITSNEQQELFLGGSFGGGVAVKKRSIFSKTWQADTAGLFGITTLSRITADHSGGLIAVGAKDTILLRYLNGRWKRMKYPDNFDNSTTITAISADRSGEIYAAFTINGYGKGVYRTGDNGDHWEYIGLDSIIVRSLSYFSDTTFVLTNGRGIYIIYTSKADVKTTADTKNAVIVHLLNNPVTTQAEFQYELPESGKVAITIFDALGREMATVVNESQPMGTHSVNWNTSGVASGTYYYQFSVDGNRGNTLSENGVMVIQH